MRSTIDRLTVVLLLAACTASEPPPDPSRVEVAAPTVDSAPSTQREPGDSVDGERAPAPDPWTIGIVDERREVAGAALLTAIRVAENVAFDRVVFEFEGDAIPSYHIEYVDRPIRQCGSGEAVEISGDGWLSIRIEPANAHTEAGESTIEERALRPELEVMREVRMICDFEAQVEWILGLSTPNPYRVMELVDPTRLIVDVSHRTGGATNGQM